MDGRIAAAPASRRALRRKPPTAARAVVRRREWGSFGAGGAVLEAEEALVRLLEELDRVANAPLALGERLRVPFAARHGEEVAAVDMNRAGEFLDGIGHR